MIIPRWSDTMARSTRLFNLPGTVSSGGWGQGRGGKGKYKKWVERSMNAVNVKNKTQKIDKTAGATHLFNFPADGERQGTGTGKRRKRKG